MSESVSPSVGQYSFFLDILTLSAPRLPLPRYRRARSSLYAGGLVPRQSLPIRTRSNEDMPSRASPEDRKKSHTSTQSTVIDTPPKTPPTYYGNTLTVGLPDMIDTIIDFEKHPDTPKTQDPLTTHRESDEFDIDEVGNVISLVTEHKANGIQRPGTPVKPSPKHAVRFVKPTLTVTSGDSPRAKCNETCEDSEGEQQEEEERVDTAESHGPAKATDRHWARGAKVSHSDLT